MFKLRIVPDGLMMTCEAVDRIGLLREIEQARVFVESQFVVVKKKPVKRKKRTVAKASGSGEARKETAGKQVKSPVAIATINQKSKTEIGAKAENKPKKED